MSPRETTSRMRVEINGREREIPSGLSVRDLLDHLQVKQELVAVEINREVVPRGRQVQVLVSQGDRIEIVTFTGGG